MCDLPKKEKIQDDILTYVILRKIGNFKQFEGEETIKFKKQKWSRQLYF